MSRRRNESKVSFFSFQDIIMSVVGVVILITLILILKLVTQTPQGEAVQEMSAAELAEQIKSLEQERREIQDEIAALRQARQNASAYVPSQEQIESLRSTENRLLSEIENLEKNIDAAEQQNEKLKNHPAARRSEEAGKHIEALQEQQAALEQKQKELKEQQTRLQAKLQGLKNKNTALDRKLAESVSQKVYVSAPQSTGKTPYVLIYGAGTITILSLSDLGEKKFSSKSAFYAWADNCNKNTEYFVLYIRPSRFEEYESVLETLKQKGFDVGLQVIGETTEFLIKN
ncbi:MAG: hypothetical protein LBT89_05775 [Planctomycetaceae bacterium]|jgi:hypothetical protein|nr:hypothetical protein [Planctomycetaceae bacterium]